MPNKSKKTYKKATFKAVYSKADELKVNKMQKEIRKVGGVLHFDVKKHKNGWIAQCKEIDGIITGGTTKNPTNLKIEKQIKEAIQSAFGLSDKVSIEDVIRNVEEPALAIVG